MEMHRELASRTLKPFPRPVLRFFLLELGYIICNGFTFLLGIVLIILMHHNRRQAFRGNKAAARNIILPAFEPFLWVICFVTSICVVFFTVLLATKEYGIMDDMLPAGTIISTREFLFILILIYMLQKSVSKPALKRALALSAAITVYPILVTFLLQEAEISTEYIAVIVIGAKWPMMALFAYALLYPPTRASSKLLRIYCGYVLTFYIFYSSYELTRLLELWRISFYLTQCATTLAAFSPIFIWKILRQDTEHWRGLSSRAIEWQTNLNQQGGQMQEVISNQGLHVLIEMHRKFLIDFAYLHFLGKIGGHHERKSSQVFQATLRGHIPVAVKVYTPDEFNEEVLASFSHEMSLARALVHPNIVKLYGMCVCPPTVCLVSELCQLNLHDVITLPSLDGSKHVVQYKYQALCNVAYTLDATRAVAYLHSFSPPFIHRDIKPNNFVLNAEGTLKLADFGESQRSKITHPDEEFDDKLRGQNLSQMSLSDVTATVATTNDHLSVTIAPSQIRSMKGTVEYMAPEIISGNNTLSQFTRASDIYSLAMTLWDIWHTGQLKYPSMKHHLQIFQAVLKGVRPILDPNVPSIVQEVIESGWSSCPEMRPSAIQIIDIFEEVQEDLSVELVEDLMGVLRPEVHVDINGVPRDNTYTGQYIIATMLHCEFVSKKSEAIRMGNSLMDSGVLHHINHSERFSDSGEAFAFDEELLQLSMRKRKESSRYGSARPCIPDHLSPRSMYTLSGSSCRCRKLALGFGGRQWKTSAQLKEDSIAILEETTLTTKLLTQDMMCEVPTFRTCTSAA